MTSDYMDPEPIGTNLKNSKNHYYFSSKNHTVGLMKLEIVDEFKAIL